MPKAVIEDWEQFNAYLAAQPLMKWCAEKQRAQRQSELSHALAVGRTRIYDPPPPKQDDRAELAAALSSMA